MQPTFIYTPEYDFQLPEFGDEQPSNLHSFDGLRSRRAWELFESSGPLRAGALHEPRMVTREELELVHAREYLDSLRSPKVIAEILEIELAAAAPIELLEYAVLAPMRLATGGTILAAELALAGGLSFQLGGGYHHSMPQRGEGFCIYNDIAIAIRAAQAKHGIERVMVVDLDAHQGNGVEVCFKDDHDVAVFDIYNYDTYPQDEVARYGIRWDHPLRAGTAGTEYLDLLEAHLPGAMDEFEPQLVMYNAGTDIVAGDPLGGLEVAAQDVVKRDLLVIDEAARRGIPIAITPSGGYTDESHCLIAATLGEIRARWI